MQREYFVAFFIAVILINLIYDWKLLVRTIMITFFILFALNIAVFGWNKSILGSAFRWCCEAIERQMRFVFLLPK